MTPPAPTLRRRVSRTNIPAKFCLMSGPLGDLRTDISTVLLCNIVSSRQLKLFGCFFLFLILNKI